MHIQQQYNSRVGVIDDILDVATQEGRNDINNNKKGKSITLHYNRKM
jgi:hypothetical protein